MSQHADKTFDQIVCIAKRARLLAGAIKSERLAAQHLSDEIGHHSAVVGSHIGPVGIEDTHQAGIDSAESGKIRAERLPDPFTFIIARTHPDGVDVAEIILGLRMHERIAIDFRSRGLQNFRPIPFRIFEGMERAEESDFCRVNRVALVIRRRSRTSQIADDLAGDIVRDHHVVLDELKLRIQP